MKKSKQLNDIQGEVESVLPLERIGIMMNKFMQTTPLGPQTHEKNIKCWQRGQIVWNEKDIDMLLGLNAPIKVYFRDAD